MRRIKAGFKQFRHGKAGRRSKWLDFVLLTLLIVFGALQGYARAEQAGADSGRAYAAAHEDRSAEADQPAVSVLAAAPDTVTGSVYNKDDTLGIILHRGANLVAQVPVQGTLSAASPLLQQIKLSQPSTVIPGGRGFMLPQIVSVKDPSGHPLAGVPVTFEAALDNTITAVMRGLNSNAITVTTDANGIASAANTYPGYIGEGYQVYSTSTGVIRTLDVKATVAGLAPVTFRVEVGAVGSNQVDTTPPTITASALDDTGATYIAGTWTKRTVTVHYTAVDTLSGIKSVTADQVFSSEGAGQTATGKAVDGVAASDDDKNHTSTITFGPINIDKTPPVTVVTNDGLASGGWNKDKVKLHFAAEDPLSGMASIFYKIGETDTVETAGNAADLEISADGATTVSYWAADKAGNTEAARTVTVKIDKSSPEITSILSPAANASGWNSSNVSVTLNAADDNSGVKEIHYKLGETGEERTITEASATFSVTTEGTTPLSFWAVDTAGNTSPVQRTQVKIDKSNPVLTVPRDITKEATAVHTPVQIGQATAQDVSGDETIITNDAPADYPIGTTTVKWTATDPVGNVTSQVQKITIIDTTKPVLTVQGDIVVEATGIKTPVVVSGASATDIFPVVVTNDAPKEFPVGTTAVIWTATDANGNTIHAAQNVIVADTTKPAITAPADITKEATSRRTPVAIGMATATDIFPTTISHNAPADYPVGTTKVAWKAEDANGNAALAEQAITITDTTKPVLTVPRDITVEASEKRMKLDIGQATATDIFDVEVTSDAPADYPVGTTLVTWTAKDEHNNVSKGEQKITVTDTTAPVLTVPEDITMEANDILTKVDLGLATATDVFDVDVTHNAPPSFAVGKTLVTWTAVDENGNKTQGTQSVTITDTTKPLVTLPGDKTAEATGERTRVDIGQPVVSDIFPVTVSHNAPADYPLGTTVVTWTVTDANGNETIGAQKVNVVDTTKPVLSAPKDISIEATAVRSKVQLGKPIVSDLFPVTVKNDAPSDFPIGTTKVTWTATDSSGNVSTAVQNVKVVDTTQPSLSVPPEVRVEATAVRTPVTIGQATATDIFLVTVTSDAPADYPVGTTTVTWTATDANGQVSTGKQKVIVIDTTLPVLTVPHDMTVEATAVNTPVQIGQATATDIFSVDVSSNAPASYPLGKTIVTWKATDANGNISTGTQTITVIDTTAPVIEPVPDRMVEASAKLTPVELIPPAATDIFAVTPVSSNAPAAFPLGTTDVTWTAKDANGNVSTFVQKITIEDTTKPVLTLPEDVHVEAVALQTPVEIGQATATDIFDVTVKSDAPKDYPLGVTEVTWTATDANGNFSSGVQKVTVVDTTKPVLHVPEDKTVEATAVNTPVDIGQATAEDIYEVTVSSNAPEVYPLGTTEVTWKAVDANGNESTGVQKITAVDTTKPVLEVPEDQTVEATAVNTPVNIGQATAKDIFEVTVSSDAPAAYPLGTTEVKWTATDANGNVSTGVQKITVVDTTKPMLEVPEDQTVEATAVNTPVSIGQATATDIFEVTVSSDAPAAYPLGTTEVKWTATDANSNVSTGVQKITVIDTTKPVLNVPEDQTVEATAVNTPVDIGQATATDIFEVTVSSDAPAAYPLGTTEVKWTATDANGNESTGVQKITIVDTTKPQMKFTGSLHTVLEATALATPVELEIPDVPDIFPVTLTTDAPGYAEQGPITGSGTITANFPLGTTKVTWTARDSSGNTSLGIVTVTITDKTKPVLSVPADITLEATGLHTPVEIGQATATDIYEVNITSDAPADYTLGTTKVTWTATDENGNVSTGIQKITVVDTTKPVLSVPEDKTVEATGLQTPVDIGQATATDIYEVTVSSDAPTAYALGTNEVTWTATDANGNVSTGVQKITIVDTTKPVLSLPEDQTVEATAVETPVQIGQATATDIYKVTVSSDAPTSYPLGTTEVEWTATDENGNVTTGVQKITVVDTTKPVITAPADVTVKATGIKTPVDLGQATASDIFGYTLKNDAPEGGFPLGRTAVTWTATDPSGNASTAVQYVTVNPAYIIQSYNSNRSNNVNAITPRISFENTSSSTIQLSNLKLRYYFTVDGDMSQTFFADTARVSGSSTNRSIKSYVSGSFQKTVSKPTSDYYLEISFASGAGTLKPGEKVLVEGSFLKSIFSIYTQSNDYSFNPSARDYVDTGKITAYLSGSLVAGMEP
ncbi:HYR domain-containing protein [Paenibacillus macerans]|uniref:HYR domain-containing protein n=1 Tax=Paenibacillus macerans TaxID=44252 RepID=UPI0020401914|nr:HYR domain-containing protein [Paenibacillus macerans]MCM3702390.1 HYR domain-containing protein [Paenibacillus macerans]